MGKTVRLTEEQIMRFFGPGFGKRLIGEASVNPTDVRDRTLDSDRGRKIAADKYGKTSGHAPGTERDGGMYYNGIHYLPRQGKDLPGYGGSVATMASYGAADLNGNNSIGNNELLKKIREIHGNGPLNLIDVLDILHQLNGKKAESPSEEAFEFLNSINVNYILGNFLTVNAPDYMFWRLQNLTQKEIQNIKLRYGRDLSAFGQRCDGCGITEWKTTVTPFEHDDAHINLEYMGSDAAEKPLSLNESGGPRRFMTYPVPFQIHHMNENPGDNNPLNLSCLCPNCHALTGSFGMPKENIDATHMKALSQLEDMLGGVSGADGSLAESLMSDEEKRQIVASLKGGEFDRSDVADSLAGVNSENYEMDPSKLAQFGIDDPGRFMSDFDDFFRAIYQAGLNEYKKHYLLNEDAEITGDNPEGGDDTNSTADTITKGEKDFDGVKIYYAVRCSGQGNVTLSISAGTESHIFDAFQNKAIPLTPMYYETPENRRYAMIQARNGILKAILNSIKEVKKGKMSGWEGPSWIKNDGEVVQQRIKDMKPAGNTMFTFDDDDNITGFTKERTGRIDAESLFDGKKSENYSIKKGRDLKAAKQASQKGNFTTGDLEQMFDMVTYYPDALFERMLKGKVKGNNRFEDELVEHLINIRNEHFGEKAKTQVDKREKMINWLGPFYTPKKEKF